MNEKVFNEYMEENKGYKLFGEHFSTLSPSQILEAYNNARKNNYSFKLLEWYFGTMEIWQRNETLEDALEQKKGVDLFYGNIWDNLTPSQKGKVLKSIAKNNQYDYKMLFDYNRLLKGTPKNHRQKFYRMVFSSILKNKNPFPVEFFYRCFDLLNEKQKKQAINKGLESKDGFIVFQKYYSLLNKKQKLKGMISLIRNTEPKYESPETVLKNIFVLYYDYYNDFDKKSQSIIIDELAKSRYNYILLRYDILSKEQELQIIESIVEDENLTQRNWELLKYHFNKFKGEYRKKAFDNAIKNNEGYNMITTSGYDLSKDEFELAFENALKNKYGKKILLYHSSSYKLTEEQIKRCKEQI